MLIRGDILSAQISTNDRVAKDHRFDIVTHICIYCNMHRTHYYNTNAPCTRPMDDAPSEEEE